MRNKLLFLYIGTILFIITYYRFNYFSLGLMILILIYLLIIKKYKLLIIYLSFFLVIYISININDNNISNCSFNDYFTVVEVKNNYSIIEQDNNLFIIYNNDNVLIEGNKIKITGSLKEINDNGIPYLYSFKDYLYNKNIFYQIDYKSINIVNNSPTIRYQIISGLTNKLSYSKDYLNLLLFNNKSLELEIFYDNLIKISAVQLFVISGFHIVLLKNILDKVFCLITKRKENIFTIIILSLYIYLLNFSLSSLRAFIAIILRKIKKLDLTNIDINSLIGISFLLYNPKYLFLVSYQLSFLMTITVLMVGLLPLKYRKYLLLIMPFLVSLPLIINMNSEIGIINILVNYLFTPLVSVIYMLGLIVLIFSFLDKYLYFLILGFEELTNVFTKFNIYLTFPYLILPMIIIYFILIYNLVLKIYLKRKIKYNIILIIIFLLNWYIKPFSSPYIIFFDVGQGDSILIHGQNNKYNILIDTGGNRYSDLATNKLIPYLKKEGIRKLDLVIISHLDFDHYGALDSLNKNFNIEKIIDDSNYHNIFYKDINFINLNQNEGEGSDKNEQSSVLLFDFIGLKFLLTGDAPKKIEKEIIETYDINIDVLKVAHHGSNTSTCLEFLKEVKPELAIISVGRNNIYGHPSSEVIRNLEQEKIVVFRTDKNGSIKISKNIFNQIIISKKFS